MMNSQQQLKIGELAKICNISVDTLRFYETNGLLSPQSRTESGYRLYTATAIQKVDFILRAKEVGLSLQEISELLAIKVEAEAHSCAEVKQVIDNKREQIEQKIAELQRFHSSLLKLSDSCCGGPKSARHCSILEALASHDSQNNAHKPTSNKRK